MSFTQGQAVQGTTAPFSKGVFVRYIERKESRTWDDKPFIQDCVIETGGIKIILNSAEWKAI